MATTRHLLEPFGAYFELCAARGIGLVRPREQALARAVRGQHWATLPIGAIAAIAYRLQIAEP